VPQQDGFLLAGRLIMCRITTRTLAISSSPCLPRGTSDRLTPARISSALSHCAR